MKKHWHFAHLLFGDKYKTFRFRAQADTTACAALKTRDHNDRFMALMDTYMPLWGHYREALNRSPLGHENWDY